MAPARRWVSSRAATRAGCAGHAGYLGSTAHTDGIAVAVSGAAPPLTALGVDVERAGALATSDAVLVMAPDELEMLAREPELAQELATCLWSAKEATFKAWCAASRTTSTVLIRARSSCVCSLVQTRPRSMWERPATSRLGWTAARIHFGALGDRRAVGAQLGRAAAGDRANRLIITALDAIAESGNAAVGGGAHQFDQPMRHHTTLPVIAPALASSTKF